MSFSTMKVDELRSIADSFGVDLGKAKNKADIIAHLAEEGVTWDIFNNVSTAERPVDTEIETFYQKKQTGPATGENLILVKMDRANPLYEVNSYTFTSKHPFVAMPEDDAQAIFDAERGFRIATPSEARNFYS
jgi:hypothetical protein